MLERTNATLVLKDLAQRIEAEHKEVGTALQSALVHAVAAGELLIEAKRTVKHGQWLKWLAANLDMPKRTAAHYMVLARRRQEFCGQNGKVLPISVTEALKQLKHYPEDTGSYEEFAPYVPYRGWGRLAWGVPFVDALQTTLSLPRLNPPAARYVVKAARAGKTPGLTPAALRSVVALLNRYADALEKKEKPASTGRGDAGLCEEGVKECQTERKDSYAQRP
jgi:hypothetical protein